MLSKASPDDRETIEGWLADGDVQGEQIARSIPAEFGFFDGGTIQRHRRGQCSCGRN